MTPIYAIGNLGFKQCAMRADGRWFERHRVVRMGRRSWSRWEPIIGGERPAHAWYDPAAGFARLPKD